MGVRTMPGGHVSHGSVRVCPWPIWVETDYRTTYSHWLKCLVYPFARALVVSSSINIRQLMTRVAYEWLCVLYNKAGLLIQTLWQNKAIMNKIRRRKTRYRRWCSAKVWGKCEQLWSGMGGNNEQIEAMM